MGIHTFLQAKILYSKIKNQISHLVNQILTQKVYPDIRIHFPKKHTERQ